MTRIFSVILNWVVVVTKVLGHGGVLVLLGTVTPKAWDHNKEAIVHENASVVVHANDGVSITAESEIENGHRVV